MTDLRVDGSPGAVSDEGLIKAIGPVALTAAIVNVIVGAGILMLPAMVAREVGRAAPFAYLLAAGAMVLVTLCFVEAGAQTSRSGGPYAYAHAAFGPYVAFMTGMALWLSSVLASGAVSAGLVSWCASAVPWLAHPPVRATVMASVYAGIVFMNLRGVRSGTALSATTSVLKISVLVLVVLLGLRFVEPANVAIVMPSSFEPLGRAAMVLVLAFAGMETALGASGEIRTPARTVPIALAVSTAFVIVLYASIQFVAQGVLGASLGASQAPLADALGAAGPATHWLIVIGGAISMLGFLAGDLLGISRVLFALAAAGHLPAPLGRVTARTHVPATAIVAHACVGYLLALSGSYDSLAIFSSLATVILYIICCAAAWKLAVSGRARSPLLARFGPLGWLIPIGGIAALGAMLLQASGAELRAAALAMAATTALYFVPWTRGRTVVP